MTLSGSQGHVKFITIKGIEAVAKWSKYVDYTIELEATVLKKINSCHLLSAHYPKYIGLKQLTRKGVPTKQLLTSRVQSYDEYNDVIRQKLHSSIPTASSIVQNIAYMTLCASEMLRLKLGIVHNDLHTSNVLVVKTDANVVEYKFPGDRTYKYKTYGLFPIIIDFGYAYIEGDCILAPSCCMDIGYATDEQDKLSDARILLTKVSESMRKYGGNKEFTSTVERLFEPLQLDSNGWFADGRYISATDEMMDIVGDLLQDSHGIFDTGAMAAEDLMNLFISQLYPPHSKEDVLDVVNLKANAVLAFAAFKTAVTEYPRFSTVGTHKQLSMIKEWLTVPIGNLIKKYGQSVVPIVSACKSATTSFEPIVDNILWKNREIRQLEYNKLSVSTILDILDALPHEDEQEPADIVFDCR